MLYREQKQPCYNGETFLFFSRWGVNCGIMVVVQNYRWLHLYISMICNPQESITNRHLYFCPQFDAELVDRVVP